MLGKIVKRVLLPLILWFPIVVIPALFISEQYSTFQLLPALVYTTSILYWWLTGLARWLLRRWKQVILAYLLNNFTIALTLTSVLLIISYTISEAYPTWSSLSGFVGLLAGPLWLIWSITHLIRYGQRRKSKSLLWRMLSAWFADDDVSPVPQVEKKPKVYVSDMRPVVSSKPVTSTAAVASTLPAESSPTKQNLRKSLFTQFPAVEDSEARGVVIPSRPQRQSSQEASLAQHSEARVTIGSGDAATEFVRDGKQWAIRQERVAVYVPFESYWPTYRQMSSAQQRWYFYWRTQVRQGNLLTTDLSYLFVYVYELINLIGVNSPAMARDQLVAFWQHYRLLQPKLDGYLVDWIADFTVIHALAPSPLSWYAHALATNAAVSKNQELLFLEAWHHQGRDYAPVPSRFFYKIANYATGQNKFYQAYHQELALDQALKRGIETVDGYVQQTQQCSLFELDLPAQSQTVVRVPLQGAVHIYPDMLIVIAHVRPWLAEATLPENLKAILRYTENILRTQAAYKTKLRGVTLSPAWASVLQQAFVKTAPKRTVTIDLASAATLQRESDELRQRLLAASESEADDVVTLPLADASPSNASATVIPNVKPTPVLPGVILGSSYAQRPEDTADGLLTDLPSIAAIMGNPASEATALLRALQAHDWQMTPKQLAELKSIDQSGFVNLVYDRVNERAVTEIGDALIFVEGDEWVVAEDYRDEIAYILEHPDFVENLSATA